MAKLYDTPNRSFTACKIKESCGRDDRGYGAEGNWLEEFKRQFEIGYKKFWQKRGLVPPDDNFKESNNSFFVTTK